MMTMNRNVVGHNVFVALLISALGVVLLQPVSGFAQPTDLSGLKFCIDPGHGGHNGANDRHVIPDPGTDYWESESNFQKALRLDTLLQARGAWVLLTRYTNDYPADDEPSLSARRTLANANNVHWFHSIHSNATGWASNTTVNYTLMLVREEISTRQPSWPEAVTMSNIIGPAIQAKLRNSPRSTWTYLDYTFYGGTSGGFNLGVLNGTSMPAELSEGSFHDFFPETRRLMNHLYCKMEAYALRNSFMQYYGVPADTMGIIAGIQSNLASGEMVNLTRVRLLPDDRVVVGDAYNNGFYMFDNVAPGTYTLRFETPGYTVDSAQVTVGTGVTVFVDRSLISFASPSVLATVPSNNDTVFSAASPIDVSFSKPMDTASVRLAFSITPAVPGQLVWNSSNTRLTFDPAQILPFYVDFVVEIDTTARSASGQGLDANGDGVSGDPLVLSFRTKYIDVFAPVLVQARPDSGERLTAPQAVLNLTFDERLNQSTVTIANIVVQRVGGTAQLRTLEYAEENGKAGVSVYFPNGLLPGEAYRAGIKGIGDLLGNTMPTSTFQIWDFSIGSGAYVTTVLDSVAAATTGFVSPSLPTDMAGADSVTVAGSTVKKLGLNGTNAGSAQIRVQWDTSAAEWLVRARTDPARPAGQLQFPKTNTLLRAHVYGDGSNSRMRFVVADSVEAFPGRPPEHREVTRWIPIDWVGWRAVTWDLEADTLGSGTGNGVLEGQLGFDGIELAYTPGTSLPVTSVYVDHLELVGRTVTAVEEDQHGVPVQFALHQNTPNPFNPSTKIWYDLGSEGDVSLVVYDVLGREVVRLVDRHQTAGRHWAEWDPSLNRNMSSGVYIARLAVRGEAGAQLFVGSIKLLMVR